MKKTLREADLAVQQSNEELILFPEKVIYWPRRSTIIVSDLHLGKSGHLRKNGIPVPSGTDTADLERLGGLIRHTMVERVLMLGDIFHSTYNPEWEHFVQFIRQRKTCSFELVPGNHDILDVTDYQRAGIKVLPLVHTEGPFIFSHEKIDDLPDQFYCFAGHEHPAIRMVGRGRQKLTLPCFFFGVRYALMPAFGGFTGVSRILPSKDDRVFAIADDRVIDVSA